jgi:hypothetical protein
MAWFGRLSRERRTIRSRMREAGWFKQAQSHGDAEQAATGWPSARER